MSDAHLAARRHQIVDAATALFAERGFARTSMADIVGATGLSTGAVYRYFSSKEDLVLAVVMGRDGQRETGGFPQESAVELLRRLVGYIAPPESGTHARLVTQIWGEAAVTPALGEVARERHEPLQRHLASLLDARRTPGGAPDPDHDAAVAQVALASLIGCAALTATGTHVDMDGFLRVLERLISEE